MVLLPEMTPSWIYRIYLGYQTESALTHCTHSPLLTMSCTCVCPVSEQQHSDTALSEMYNYQAAVCCKYKRSN